MGGIEKVIITDDFDCPELYKALEHHDENAIRVTHNGANDIVFYCETCGEDIAIVNRPRGWQ